MKRLLYALGSMMIIVAMIACGDTSTIGNSILTEEVEILVDSSFTVKGKAVDNVVIPSKTTMQLLGKINATQYGMFESEFVTQFMPAASLDTLGIQVENIDSLQLIMAVPAGSIVGDSVIPMGLEVYELTQALPAQITSNFNPEGYYDSRNMLASTIYNCSALGEGDSVEALNYRFIYVSLPQQLGRDLYQAYLDNPSAYLTPETFTSIFKGLYVKNSFGSGRVARISSTLMRLHWHTDTIASDGVTDSIIPGFGNYFAVTPEIITNNDINYSMAQSLQQRIAAGEAIISAPTGSDVELSFPAQAVVDNYRKNSGKVSMVNDLEMTIPAAEISNTYNINPPPYLLMVLSSKKDEFFKDNQLPDNETSFYASYDADSRSYKFTSMREYVLWLLNKSSLTTEDYTFTLTPISLSYGTNSGYYGQTSYLESVTPYVLEPTMVQLNVEKIKIIFTYSRQFQK